MTHRPRALAIVLCTCLSLAAACAGQAKLGSSASVENYRLQGVFISGPDFTSILKRGDKLSAAPPLVAHLTQQGARQPVEIAVSADTPLLTVLRFLLSADEASVISVSLRSKELSLELALPNDERWPPAAAADVYLSLHEGRVKLGRQLSDLTGDAEQGRTSAWNDEVGLSDVFSRVCGQGSCQNAVLAARSTTKWKEVDALLPHLMAHRRARGSLRLMSTGEGASASSSQRDPALNASAVRETIASHRSELELCHQSGPQGVEVKGGTLLVSFVVTPLGLIFDAKADLARSTLLEPSIVRCVEDAFARMKFPRPKTETSLEYLLRF